MKSPTRHLVHRAIAARAGILPSHIDDQQSLADFGLDELDLLLIAAQIGTFADLRNDFPLEALDPMHNVGQFVEFVDSWRAKEDVHTLGVDSTSERTTS